MYEKALAGRTVGAGLPYQLTQSRSNIMNDSINYISVKGYDEPDHFMVWLEREKPRWGALFPEIASGFDLKKINPGGTFLPRIIVGMYLDDAYKECLRKIDNGGKPLFMFQLIEKDVSDVRKEAGKDMLIFADGTQAHSHFTVLATGNVENINYKELAGTPGYFAYHYRHEDAIRDYIAGYKKPEIKALILGTRLAGVDGTVLLNDFIKANPSIKSYKLTMTSREGVIPMVRVPPKPGSTGNLKYINTNNINAAI